MSPPPAHKIEKPDTLDVWRKGVDADMTEGKRLVASIEATTKGMLDAQKETQKDVRELREQMREHETLNAERAEAARVGLDGLRADTAAGFKEVDTRLGEFAKVQAEQGEQLRQLVASEATRDAERKAQGEMLQAQGEMLRRIDTALTARAAVEADRAAVSQPGDSPPLPSLSPTHPNLPALPPRRVPLPAVVGGTLGTLGLAVVGVFSSSPILQGGLAVAMGILAIGAVMWALKHYAPRV